jgi:hypothetical protein
VTLSQTPKVLYVGGSGRSGSTLLSRLLGELPSFFPAGELRYLWREGLGEDRLCGCGERFSSCRFWSSVGKEAFGGWDQIDRNHAVELESAVSRQRHIPYLVNPRLSSSFEGRLEEFEDILQRLYAAIANVADARVIVDSSKDPAYALTLWRTFAPNLTAIHLVRDSRAVAFSWGQQTRSLDRPGSDSLMQRFGPGMVGLRWTAYNSAMELLRALHVPYVRVRYEDLINDPQAQILRVGSYGKSLNIARDVGFVDKDEALVGKHHTLAGNPMRFDQGALKLRLDDRWKTQGAVADRRLVTALTWPLLKRYGFAIAGAEEGTVSSAGA